MLLHMLNRTDWEIIQTEKSYSPDSLETEGFIHCSHADMIVTVANGLYMGQPEMVILVIDADKVKEPIIYEDCYETGHPFPHIYGPLNLDAVTDVIDFPCDEKGVFTLPDKLSAIS